MAIGGVYRRRINVDNEYNKIKELKSQLIKLNKRI